MKIAAKLSLVSLVLLGAGFAAPVSAQVPASTSDAVAASAAVVSSMETGEAGMVSPSEAGIKLKKEDGSFSTGKQVPEGVKSVVKRLNAATEGASLEDLNAAREAIAKLDVLIDIEKRLNDLATIRKERDKDAGISAIPASALGFSRALPPAAPVAVAPAPVVSVAPAPSPIANVDVQRVLGIAGRYTATIKADGKTMTVSEGEKLSDGSVVQSISSQGVTIVKDKNKRTFQVKDIGAVVKSRS